MEIQLQELIERIKKEGVESAEAQAEAILEEARKKADQILSDAREKADRIVKDAKLENERIVQSGEEALRQAGRNLLLSFRESVTCEIGVILNEKVRAVYSSEQFAALLTGVAEAWAKNPDAEDIALILNSDCKKALEESVLAGLKEKMLQGVTLKAGDSFDGGFRIEGKNGSAYYDYSAEAVVEMLSTYLAPEITRLLKEA